MKKILFLSVMAMLAVTTYGREIVSSTAKVSSDTIFYAANQECVANRAQASYYRLLKTQGNGLKKQDVFQDYYLNGQLKAEGGYSFVDLSNDKNTVLNGEVATYYPNGKLKMRANYKNGQPVGYMTINMRDGSVVAAEFVDGQSKYDYFTITHSNGNMEERPISELRSLLQ